MSVNFNPVTGYNGVGNIGQKNVVTNAVKNVSTPQVADKTAGIDKAMSIQGMTNRPMVITSDEITFGDNGMISAQRLTSIFQGGKLKTNSTGKVPLPMKEGLSLEEQKKQYVDKMFENTQNIRNCVFLMKSEDGGMSQINMAPDKNAPNRIIVSKKDEQTGEFKEIDDFTFDSSSKDTDRLMAAAVHTYIDFNGFENLYQLAIGKSS